MAVYEIVGTQFVTSGSKRKWSLFRRPLDVGTSAIAGPFPSRKASIEWVQAQTDD